MPNGAAVALSFAPEPPSQDKPTSGIELEIGNAVASATTALATAMCDHQRMGALAAQTREAGAARIAKVVELCLRYDGKIDFGAVAKIQGRIILRQCLDADFYRHYSREQGDAALDLYIGGLLEIVQRVVELEQALAN